jgi:hypothetical protein
MKFEGIEIALECIWCEDNRWKSARRRGEGKENFPSPRPRADFQRLSSYQIPSSAISIPSNFIFFKSLCGGESSAENRLKCDVRSLCADYIYIYIWGESSVENRIAMYVACKLVDTQFCYSIECDVRSLRADYIYIYIYIYIVAWRLRNCMKLWVATCTIFKIK